MKHEYNKLVRDKIPDIIRESGRSCDYKILSDAEVLDALKDKLIEKANIFAERPSEDEISDIYELIDAIVEKFDYEPMHIDYLKLQNKESKGTYSAGYPRSLPVPYRQRMVRSVLFSLFFSFSI